MSASHPPGRGVFARTQPPSLSTSRHLVPLSTRSGAVLSGRLPSGAVRRAGPRPGKSPGARFLIEAARLLGRYHFALDSSTPPTRYRSITASEPAAAGDQTWRSNLPTRLP